jgi:N-methylhydantoinase A/oxoprolinase/acetone carboxylase beta subunit/N-methylhydantoinase B/oxoprolinase/acetone carboxylase alpha subunit
MTNAFSIAIDTGGTFTDCIAIDPNGQILTCKVLSNSTLRGSIAEWLDAKTLKIDHSWPIKRDILKGYEFKILNNPLTTNHVFTINNYDAINKIIKLNKVLPIELMHQKLSFSITANEEAPILAARIITQTALSESFPPLSLRLGTTKGTNALLEKKGAKTAFMTTEGFADILEIGTQQRPDLFAINIIKPKQLYTEGVEISERLNANGTVLKPLTINNLEKEIKRLKRAKIESVAVALMHSYLNPEHEKTVKNILEKHFKYVSISSDMSGQIKFVPRAQTTVVNAYLQPILENYLSKINEKLPPNSLRIMTSAGSLIQPNLINKELIKNNKIDLVKNDLIEGKLLENNKKELINNALIDEKNTHNSSLIIHHYFQPKDSLLSGPAGGIVGAAAIGKQSNYDQLITFDMGGTSTDVARFDGDFDYKFSVEIGGATVFSPALAIETVAAGGGSICRFDGQKLVVGPESAGAFPGPACYGAGGDLTITDAHLLLGRLDASAFGIPVFLEAAKLKLDALRAEIIEKTRENIENETILNGFLTIANEKMADAIRKISTSKGYAPPQYALLSFGGAGGLHACSLAKLLNMSTIIIPKYAGILSAYGILNAAIERIAERQILKTTDVFSLIDIKKIINELKTEAIEKVAAEGVPQDKISVHKTLIFCRLKGQDAALDIPFSDDFERVFEAKYRQVFGHWLDSRIIEIESIRVIAKEVNSELKVNNDELKINNDADLISDNNLELKIKNYELKINNDTDLTANNNLELKIKNSELKINNDTDFIADNNQLPIENNQLNTPHAFRLTSQYKADFRHKITAFVDGNWAQIPVYFRDDLTAGATINGFALLLDNYATTVIEKDFTLTIDANETAILTLRTTEGRSVDGHKTERRSVVHSAQTIDLELFTNRFTAIADNMGALLQRTSLSVNVKERLDFSCALLDADGELIANAPHIPVHLGSLGVCVRRVVAHLGILEKGDVIVTNHPAFGGSHLPDVTVISPVFEDDLDENAVYTDLSSGTHEGSSFELKTSLRATKQTNEGIKNEENNLKTIIKNKLINNNKIIKKDLVNNENELINQNKNELIEPIENELIKPKNRLIGYVANRCHHSEIGGIRPASMPPNATELTEEGVIIEPTFLVKRGVIDWETISYKLQSAKYPTRALSENLADLNAALAANLNGVAALQALVKTHSLETVHFYMQRLKDYSAEKLNTALLNRFKENEFNAEEKLDDNTILKVKISIKNALISSENTINPTKKITFDFTGSSPVHKGNLNATPAIVNSVVIYVLRLLITENIPLNEGFMKNVTLILPENSILNPNFNVYTEGSLLELKIKNEGIKNELNTELNTELNQLINLDLINENQFINNQLTNKNPAVVGGNVETSQRLTDTIIKAFKLLACGQGTMNNVLFGNDSFGYYETICGGAGASDGFDGANAVHTHMTNTRITDPEILEFRYPVRLDLFKIKPNSGGKGAFHGGNGIIRQLTFLENVQLSVLSQHRKVAPYGLNGGKNGRVGQQYLILKNGEKHALKHMDGAQLSAGDAFVIETPSGGGFGERKLKIKN